MLISYNKDNGWGGLIHDIIPSRRSNATNSSITISDDIRNALNGLVAFGDPNTPSEIIDFDFLYLLIDINIIFQAI